MSTAQISKKKLKAIVFTDMADFTKISAQDENKALDLIQKQNDIIKPIVEKHNGEWLKELGDGLLLSFDSSLEAVRCSIEIQEILKDIDDLNIRIGIHQGDIFIMDGDVFGDDVNIASRVEGFAPIGGIALSDKVHKDISGVSDIKTSFIGHRKLKGVEQETKIRCITSHNLPKNKKSYVPIIGAYIHFFVSTISFLAFGLYVLNKLILNFSSAIFTSSESIYIIVKYLGFGYTSLVIGYACLSYHKGLSTKSQKLIVFLAYIYFLIPLITLPINPNVQRKMLVYTEKINESGIEFTSLEIPLVFFAMFALFIVLPIIIIALFKSFYYMKTKSSLSIFKRNGMAFVILLIFIALYVGFIFFVLSLLL
mgnify:FL=1